MKVEEVVLTKYGEKTYEIIRPLSKRAIQIDLVLYFFIVI